MNQVGRKNFVEKPPTFVPLGKSPVMRAIFAGPLLTPLFSRAAFSWRLVCESLPWEWAHESFFCLCLGSFLWHLSLWGLGFLASMKIGRRVLVIVFCVWMKTGGEEIFLTFWKGQKWQRTPSDPASFLSWFNHQCFHHYGNSMGLTLYKKLSNNIKAMIKHYGPRRWLLWPVIWVW